MKKECDVIYLDLDHQHTNTELDLPYMYIVSIFVINTADNFL